MGLKGSCMCKAIKYESTGRLARLQHCVNHADKKQRTLKSPPCATAQIAKRYENPNIRTLIKSIHVANELQWSGSAFTSNAVVPRTSFKVTQGEPKFYDITGDSGKNNRHFFCSNCGSSLYTELDLMADVTCIKAGGLDEGKASLEGKPAVEFYCKDRVSYLVDVKGADQKPAFS
ncbi:glutathione-dependent formaldehyde-activating enzyme [Colletotrichum limetticola]|uniref:Glutathione-dependent formaldehyde-activating enzyme n=1 Tax=Colletotrichum limetticola TaxID=1209924 RepID=A0ABQ9Q0V9_9PEZI|nr:glutathione-dependent formaldehyde-activating enzyme [Colletotrichum limetticola]